MKSDPHPGAAHKPAAVSSRFTIRERFALLFGLFLGLALLKFGNPVILDDKIRRPLSWTDAWNDPWPPHWLFWLIVPLMVAGILLAITSKSRWPASRWLWVLPVVWFAWQLVSATHSVDQRLTM